VSWRTLLAGILLCVHVANGNAAEWVPVTEASRLEFIATYQGQAVRGVFHQFEVRFALTAEKPSGGKLDVSVRLQSADMDSSDVNQAIASTEWFDVARFPVARFSSNEITKDGMDHYVAKGMLSVKGVQRAVSVPFSWQRSGETARMDGQLSLKRTDFGVGTGEWATGDTIGLDVIIRFSLKLQPAA
jgi:polyisoprenoid-binding protein YceI